MSKAQKVLVLQGGGALGAYQAGVFEGLHSESFVLDWIVGTSIGAINGAIIAGNEPGRRVARLREFWEMTSQSKGGFWSACAAWGKMMEPWMGPTMAQTAKTMPFLMQGIPGFFEPRRGVGVGAEGMRSFYDTSSLERTLLRLVDFDYLNDKPCRYTACAVDVDNGEIAFFDTKSIRVEPKHVMASGALPPGFPSIEIDGRRYWDGGIYSNTPIDVVLADSERKDTVCVMVDLWESRASSADTIHGALGRQKDIQYASRVREHLRQHREMQNLRKAIHELAELAPAASMKSARAKRLAAMGCPSSINLCRLVMQPLAGDDHTKDIDFTAETVAARWAAGRSDGQNLANRPHWLAPLAEGVGMAVHELRRPDAKQTPAAPSDNQPPQNSVKP